MAVSKAARANRETAVDYLHALEVNDTLTVAALLHREIEQVEFPNRLNPNGSVRDKALLLDGMERGKTLMRSQEFTVLRSLAEGETVALEVRWSGTLAVALGPTLPAGHTMRAFFSIWLEFRDGLIVRQRNYDCFEAW